jgi:hypothetical protein
VSFSRKRHCHGEHEQVLSAPFPSGRTTPAYARRVAWIFDKHVCLGVAEGVTECFNTVATARRRSRCSPGEWLGLAVYLTMAAPGRKPAKCGLTGGQGTVCCWSACKRSGPGGWAFFRVHSNSALYEQSIVDGWLLRAGLCSVQKARAVDL